MTKNFPQFIQVANLLKEKKHFLLTTHIGPDGDAIGSSFALAHLCKLLAKEVRLLIVTPLAENLNWVPVPAILVKNIAELKNWVPDCVIALDCAEAHRAGEEIQAVFEGKMDSRWHNPVTVNIDHHEGNPNFAQHNLINATAASTAEIVAELVEYLGFKLEKELGEAVYLGLVADSGSFSYSNTSSKILNIAGRILDNGLKVEEFTDKFENNWSINKFKLWGELMQNLNLYAKGKIATSLISQEILKKHNCVPSDLESFVSILRRIKGVSVSILLREKLSDGCKASLRSLGGEGGVDVRTIATTFGGGGHKAAAGIELNLSLEEAEKLLVTELLKIM